MSDFEVAPLHLGSRYLLPLVRYTVTKTFTDAANNSHVTGEQWAFFGWRFPRNHLGYELQVLPGIGQEMVFAFDSRNAEHAVVIDNFSQHVVGESILAKEITDHLSEEGKDRITRVGHWVKGVSDSAEDYLNELRRASGNAWVANGRAGYVGNSFESIEADLRALESECLSTLAKVINAKKP